MKTRNCLLLVVSCIYCVNATYKGKDWIFILKIYFLKALLIFTECLKMKFYTPFSILFSSNELSQEEMDVR